MAATLRKSPARTSFDRAEMPKEFFFITFKAGMLLKTRESRTKYTNFERLFRRKCEVFAIFETNCLGFCKVRGESGGLLRRQVSRSRYQVSGVRCQAHLLGAEGRGQAGRSQENHLSLGSMQAPKVGIIRDCPATDDARLKFSSNYTDEKYGSY
jgi:hypothetical protein